MTTTPEILMRPFGDFVARAPANLAPERQHDLGAIWNGLPWEILFGCGEANFAAIPADGVGGEPYIVAKYAGLLSLWAATRGALIIFDAVLAAVSLGESTIPSEPGSEFLRGIAYIDFARELVRDQNAPFPGSLDSPDPSGKTMESERGNNLFLGAVGWVLLHEIGHIQLGHQAGVPEAVSKQQENDADRFASDWIFSDLHIDQRHREFRVAAVAAAMLWLGIMNQVRRGSTTHPSASERLGRSRDVMNVSDDSTGLYMATQILKATFIPDSMLDETEHAAAAFDEVLFAYARSQP